MKYKKFSLNNGCGLTSCAATPISIISHNLLNWQYCPPIKNEKTKRPYLLPKPSKTNLNSHVTSKKNKICSKAICLINLIIKSVMPEGEKKLGVPVVQGRQNLPPPPGLKRVNWSAPPGPPVPASLKMAQEYIISHCKRCSNAFIGCCEKKVNFVFVFF